MESNMHKADILTRPEKLTDSVLEAVAWFVFLPLSYFLYTFFKVKLFEVAYSYFILF